MDAHTPWASRRSGLPGSHASWWFPLTLVALFSACGAYKQTTVGPGSLWNPTERIRVTYETDAAAGVVVLESARVVGDQPDRGCPQPTTRL